MPAALRLVANFRYPTDPSNVSVQYAARFALARFLRSEARNLFCSLPTAILKDMGLDRVLIADRSSG
jgi:hypothetical protein